MIVIVDYEMGNVGSIRNMLKRVGTDATITASIDAVRSATKLILPGVGAFDTGMQHIESLGLTEVLNQRALRDRIPVLGICLGMQLLTRSSEEGKMPGLGWIAADTVRFRFDGQQGLKVPHMGWNKVRPMRNHPLFAGLDDDPAFYFVHSYFVKCDDDGDAVGCTPYGGEFASVIAHDNIWGTQFHPEKSHRFGMRLLSNFANLPE